jgi:hypothetical protein
MPQIMGASSFIDKHGDEWSVCADGFLMHAQRKMKFSTVAGQLGPLTPRKSHADVVADPAGLTAELEAARVMREAGQPTDEQRVIAVRQLAHRLARDPYSIERELVAAAIFAALGDDH